MTTDLFKIGKIHNDRTKGMQGMLYRYDQLHRIAKSLSLSNYDATNGFTARNTTSPYDENYSYDGNGNILTLPGGTAQPSTFDVQYLLDVELKYKSPQRSSVILPKNKPAVKFNKNTPTSN